MSHIVTIETQVRDAEGVQAACHRLRLPPPRQGVHKVFTHEVSGLCIQLPEWNFPVVAELATGKLHYDNYGGAWGEQRHLDAFVQAYAVEKAKIEARRKGYAATERQLADGSIRVTVNVGGAT